MFGIKKKENVATFVTELVEKLIKKYPVSMDIATQRKVSEKRLTKVLESLFEESQSFRDKNNLGVIGKAKLVNEFKWQLKDSGYSQEFIDIATEGLTIYLSREAN